MVWHNAGLFKNSVSSSGAIYISAFENKLIQEGKIFGFSKRLVIPGNGKVDITIDPTAVTTNFALLLPPLIKAFGAGPIHIDIFTNPVYTGGTTIESINFNKNSSNTSGMVILLNPVVTDDGEQQPNQYTIFSSQTGGGAHTTQTGGEASMGDLIYDLNLDDVVMFRLSNQDTTNAAQGTFVTDWAEI